MIIHWRRPGEGPRSTAPSPEASCHTRPREARAFFEVDGGAVSGISLRDARGDEFDDVARVMADAYAQYIPPNPTGMLLAYRDDVRDVRSRLGESTLIVAEDRGELVGAVTYYPDASAESAGGWPAGWAALRLLAVHPTARGRGIGRLLTEECIRRARAAGCPAIALHTTELMAVARAMYERMGFARAPERDFRPAPPILVMGYWLDLGATARPRATAGSPP
jgi:ribosomal protein S18 acetylase RimI-like enzyme